MKKIMYGLLMLGFVLVLFGKSSATHMESLVVGDYPDETPITNIFVASGTWDASSLSDGSSTSQTFTVTDASPGDWVVATPEGRAFQESFYGVLVSAQVTSANTVTVTVQNETGGTVDLSSSLWHIMVFSWQ